MGSYAVIMDYVANMSNEAKELMIKKTLPHNVDKVYINGKTVTVELLNGNKGIAKCSPEDTFDPFVGFCIAYIKAIKSKTHEMKKALNNCVLNAKKKGYKQAVFNNR